MSKDSSKSSLSAPSIIRSVVIVFGTSLAFFVGQFLAAVLVIVGLQLFGINGDRLEDLFSDNLGVQMGISILFGFLMLGFVYLAEGRKSFKSLLKTLQLDRLPDRKSLGKIFVAFGLYLLIFAVLVNLAELIPGFNPDQEQQVASTDPTGLQYIFFLISIVVLAPLIEEIIFRGFMLRRLLSYISIPAAVLISSLVFGAFHLEFIGDNPLNWAAALNTFVLALALSWLLIDTKNLWTAIGLHALKNLIAFVALFVI